MQVYRGLNAVSGRHPVAVTIGNFDGVHPESEQLLEQVAQRVEAEGIEAWFSLDPAELLGESAPDYRKLNDTLDVWFDSGVTHAAVLAQREQLQVPADMYLEGSDQHRGWFQSSLLTGCAIRGEAPFKSLLTHGFVVDGAGKKMSKSKGNVIVPQEVINTMGADILRLWVASTDYAGELHISNEILKRVVECYRRIRNTLRFLLANTNDFDPVTQALPVEQWLEFDRYALVLADDFQQELLQAYAEYDFVFITKKIQTFCSEQLGGYYLDILKDRLYTSGQDSRIRRSAQNALYHITQSLIRLIAPVLSFTAEEAWAVLSGDETSSLFEGEWYQLPSHALTQQQVQSWRLIEHWRSKINKEIELVRAEGKIGATLQAEVDLYLTTPDYQVLAAAGDELRFILMTSAVRVHAVEREQDVAIQVTPSEAEKCDRCWHYAADVGHNVDHPGLCGRCCANLFAQGEHREYA